MPTNLYGPNDNFDLSSSNGMPAIIRKFYEGKLRNDNYVEVWGTGKPLREFLHVDDMADASVFLMENYQGQEHVNIGTGKDISIGDLAEIIKCIVGFRGEIIFNKDKPDGTQKKLLDVSKLEKLGWKYKIELVEGIRSLYNWFLIKYAGKILCK